PILVQMARKSPPRSARRPRRRPGAAGQRGKRPPPPRRDPLVLAYEIRQSASPAVLVGEPRANAGELEGALQDLRTALLDVGFLNPANPERVLAELRSLAARAGPTPREVTLLRGLARQVGWAGRIARGGGAIR
ncbi:MAG: hypothetical protein ACREKF_07440, partial [Candidatus Methylomirabilales bacterium]